jgi:signal recognition particle receptor subunit alpha
MLIIDLCHRLAGKNVAAEPAEKLCQSVATKLEGSVIGTLSGVASTVREAVRESLVQVRDLHHRFV